MDSSTTINVDLSRPTIARSQVPTFSVGSDRAIIFLRKEHQRDLKVLQKSIGFRYLRCHGLFNEEMKIVKRDADGKITYDWTKVDQYIDQLRAVKLRPFVELGFMPEPLASGKTTIFYWRGNVTPPRSQDEWAALVTAFLHHQIERLGTAEVRKWFFEVWNEPNLDGFWTGKQNGYFELYATSAKAIKAVDSHLKVGGPATAGMGWIPELLDYCSKNAIPIDFVASHSYGATEGFLDEHGRGRTMLAPSPDSLREEFARAKTDIQNSPFPKLPLYITEWGPSYSPRDPIHDNYICAAYILEKLRNSEGLVDGMSYWAFSDQFEEPGPPNTPFHGGFGLMNVDGLKKPGFFAYQFLAQLGKTEVPTNSRRCIVSTKGIETKALVWNFAQPAQDSPNNPYFHQDLKPKPLEDIVLKFSGLRPGTYSLTRVGVGYMRNDVYGAYMALGSPHDKGPHLDSDHVKKLSNSVNGKPEVLADVIVGSEGRCEVRLPMRTNDVWLVTLRPRS